MLVQYSKDYKRDHLTAAESRAQKRSSTKVTENSKRVKILPYMVTPSKFTVRLSNINDHFDADHPSEVVDLMAYVQQLSGISDSASFEIKETLLTGMPKKNMTKWQAKGVVAPVSMLGQATSTDSISDKTFKVALKPMDIRTFLVTINK